MTAFLTPRQAAGEAGEALVLDGHSRAALETVQSLGRMGIAVDLAAEGDCLAARSRYCRRKLQQPDAADAQGFANWLVQLFDVNGYKLIVPSTETSLRCLLALPDSHPIRCAAVVPSNRSLEVALDKQLTWEHAQALQVPVPRTRYITSRDALAEPDSFPVVLKPAASMVNHDERLVGVQPILARARSEWLKELNRLLALCPVLEQEFVFGHGVGIECLYRDGKCLWYFQHERVHELPLTGGGSSYRRSVPVDEALLACATRLLDSLRWHGAAMVEFKGSTHEGYRLMEINPRLWGSLALTIDAGVDFPKGLWRLAIGQDPGPQPRYRSPYYTRNLELDVDWLKDNLRADHGDPLLLTRPRLLSLLEFARPLLGRESWDYFDVRDWRVWSHVIGKALAAGWQTATAVLRRAGRPYLISLRHRLVLARLGRDADARVRRVLFVCYGNICRSPLAEMHARRRSLHLQTTSAGFHDTVDRTAPEWFQRIVAELGIDISRCRSQRIDSAHVEWADLILLADLDTLKRFEREFPKALSKTTMLGLFLPSPQAAIEDPYPLDPTRARLAAEKVLVAVEGVVAWSMRSGSRSGMV